jgi:hypothetical protein
MSHLTEQHRITTAMWLTSGGGVNTSKAGFVFNERITDTFNATGRGNRSNAKPAGVDHYVFDDGTDAQPWSSRDIVEYLIKSQTGIPLNQAGVDTISWKVADDDLDLIPNWDKPEVETHYITAKQILDALINRRRLLCWWAEVDENDSNRVALKVASFTDAPISLPFNSAEIPANTFTIDLDFDEDNTAEIVEQIDTAHAMDQVIAYGARRRNVSTGVPGTSTGDMFKAGWTSSQETAYEAGGSGDAGYPAAGETTERRYWHAHSRALEAVKDVFKRFVLRKMNHPIGDSDGYANWFPNVRLQKTLPFYKGVDYTTSSIGSGSWSYPDVGRLEEREPFVIIEIPGSADHFVDMSLLGRGGKNPVTNENDIRDWSATVRIPSDGHTLSIDVVGAPQHTIAHGTFTALAEDEDDHGQWDWRKIKATVAILDERYAEGRYPEDISVATTDAKRSIRVPAGEQYKLDWVAADTIVDLNPDGTVVEISAAGFVNDSRNDLRDIAKASFTWYAKTRHALRVRTDWQPPAQNLHIGQYCTFLLVDDVPMEIGALVTQLEIQAYSFTGEEPRPDLPPVKLTITTAFGELDFLHLRSGVTRRNKTPVRKPKK